MAAGPPATAPYRLVTAWRLLRSRRINLVSMLGVTLGVASIIVVMGVMEGFQRDLRRLVRGNLADMIVEMAPRAEVAWDEMRAAVAGTAGVEASTIQRHTLGLVRAQTVGADGGRQNDLPLRVVGVVPEDERAVSTALDAVLPARGQPDDPFELVTSEFLSDDTPRVVVSAWIARRLLLGVGDPFIVIHFEEEEKDGDVRFVSHETEVIISRIYDSGDTEFDKLTVYVDLARAREEFFDKRGGTATELRIKLEPGVSAGASRETVRAGLARALAPFDGEDELPLHERIETWEERERSLLLAVDNEKTILGIVLFFIVLVACFTIFATLTMTVVEKTRDIGVLRALGATPLGVSSIFVVNGLLVGVLGAGSGFVLGRFVAAHVNSIRAWLISWFGWDIFPPQIYRLDQIPVHVDGTAAAMFAVGAAVSAFLFALPPALRAARLDPIRSLRYE